jgi:hypothetical protein
MAESTMTLRERVEAVFSDPANREAGEEYIKNIREMWKDAEADSGRCLSRMFLALVAFELITRTAITKVSIAGFQLANLALIQKFLPVVVSYYFYELTQLSIRGSDYQDLFFYVSSKVWPALSRYDLDEALALPRKVYAFNPSLLGRENEKALQVTRRVLALASFLAIPLIEIYMYYQVFHQYHFSDVISWISLAASLILLWYSVVILQSEYRGSRVETDEKGAEDSAE